MRARHWLSFGCGYIRMPSITNVRENPACMQVTLVFPVSRVMERLFTPEIASFYEKFYEDKCAHLAWPGSAS